MGLTGGGGSGRMPGTSTTRWQDPKPLSSRRGFCFGCASYASEFFPSRAKLRLVGRFANTTRTGMAKRRMNGVAAIPALSLERAIFEAGFSAGLSYAADLVVVAASEEKQSGETRAAMERQRDQLWTAFAAFAKSQGFDFGGGGVVMGRGRKAVQ